jgi:hypothetical protein
MRKLLLLLGLFAVIAGCGVRGPLYPNTSAPAVATPGTLSGNLSNLGSFCATAPTLAPGTYPVLEAVGTLTGTSYTIDSSLSAQDFGYVPVVYATSAPTVAPSPGASPTPAPTGSPYDVWEGLVTFSGTPHDTTECFLAAAYVSRAAFNGTDNAETIAEPVFANAIPENSGAGTTYDTVQNFVLTLSTTSVSSGSFSIAGGGHATIAITSHGVFSDAQYRKSIEDARRRHQLLPALR